MTRPVVCNFVRASGVKCHAFANRSGRCPTHAGFVARGSRVVTFAQRRHNARRLAALLARGVA